ncbi:MAG: Rpn family recombination-promoting nuclease/putative transposase [Lachnospiraceae bacterium]|nr:Rpn family recombination-promoting nuclease/putative transposase [Lachnospiraceae bacterium]
MTTEEKLARVRDFRLIDDVFFEVFAQDKAACQEILRVILEDDALTVEDVVVQSSERNIYGRSVRLDALCTLGDGTRCNIELQRADNDDHFRRVRFNAASITVKDSEPGERFGDILDLYMVYISEHDFIGDGYTAYHVDKVIRETGKTVDDGVHEVYVNTKVKDGSRIAELMDCFTEKKVENRNFPAVTERFRELKETEGGADAVCEIVEKLVEEGRAEGREEGAERMAKLMDVLLFNGLIEDMKKVTKDKMYRESLYKKYNL